MGSNADGNTAVKWKRDEQCSLVTLLTACCFFMDCKLCSIGLEMDENLFCLRLVVLSPAGTSFLWYHFLARNCAQPYILGQKPAGT